MEFETLIQSFANALVLGSIYAMVAVGLALAFGVMQMANFAHVENEQCATEVNREPVYVHQSCRKFRPV